MKIIKKLGLYAAISVIALVWVGCATVEKNTAMNTERMLSASGFQLRLADTPQKLEKVKAMSQRKLIHHQSNGSDNYIYADAKDCKCLYVGTEKAYNKFRSLAAERLSEDEMTARDENVAMDWNVWGGPPGSDWEYWQ